MTTTEFCMMLVMLFLTWHLWRMSKRIRKLELHDKAQWDTISRLWETISRLREEIRANRKRIAVVEQKDVLDSIMRGDGNG